MRMWLIPMIYTTMSCVLGYVLPRLEHTYLPTYSHEMSVSSAIAFFSAVSSGMMALTGIVFAITFVVVQFSALAYSPRVVIMFVSNPILYHSLGIFFATFGYALVALIWTDRGGDGVVPLFSTLLVICLLIVSMLAFVLLVQSINDLQIHNVLHRIGSRGRQVIGSMFPRLGSESDAETRTAAGLTTDLGTATQTLVYSGKPLVLARVETNALARLAQRSSAFIAIECGVGETLVEDEVLLRVYGASRKLRERSLMRAFRLSKVRTFEQDPRYAIRLLVDIAIRALSPAVNDPTTAVQALDQIEDLLRRLGQRRLGRGYARDASGTIRVTFPVPTWEDYLELSFDEIRQFGATSVQVVRRLRSALVGLSESITDEERRSAVLRYLDHLDRSIGRSGFDDYDRTAALQEDRQGLGLSRKHPRQAVANGDSPGLFQLPTS